MMSPRSWRRLWLLLPTLVSYSNFAELLWLFRWQGRPEITDAWLMTFALPATLAGPVNYYLAHDIHSRKNKGYPLESLILALIYLAANFVLSWGLGKNPEIVLHQRQVGVGYALTILAVPLLHELWRNERYILGSIANSSFFVWIGMGMLWAGGIHADQASLLRALGQSAILGGATYLAICAFACRGLIHTTDRNLRIKLLPWINPSLLINERLLLDQVVITAFAPPGSGSLYYGLSRALNIGFSFFSAIFLPERAASQSEYANEPQNATCSRPCQNWLLSALALIALGITLRFGLNRTTLCLAIAPALWVCFSSSAALLKAATDRVIEPQVFWRVGILWLLDFSGRLAFYFLGSISGYVVWSLIMTAVNPLRRAAEQNRRKTKF